MADPEQDDSEETEDDSREETNSPALSVFGSIYQISFGTVLMLIGLAIAWGLTRDLDKRWDKALREEGYGTTEELRARDQERAEFGPSLAAWRVRDAARLETVKATLPADVPADQERLAAAMDELRDQANDWEPREPADPLEPLPEGTWDRFTALTTHQRFQLFKGLMVGPVFFLPGFFIAFTMLLALIGERGARRLAREFPQRPWLHHSEWSQLRGSPQGTHSVAGISMMLAFIGWLALCATVMWILEPGPPGNFTFLMFMANFLTALTAVLAVRRILQRFKYGQPQLLLAQVPIEQGKTFSARLLMSRSVGAAQKLKTTLRLEKSTTTGSGKNQHTHLEILCKRELEVPRSAFFEQDGRLAAELRFEVPDHQPFTHSGARPGYEWLVAVEAETAGVDFEETFAVPVYPLRSDDERTLR